MWKRIAVYGLLLGLGTLALQWLDYQRMARLHMRGVYDFLLVAGFLAVGLWIGARGMGGWGWGVLGLCCVFSWSAGGWFAFVACCSGPCGSESPATGSCWVS